MDKIHPLKHLGQNFLIDKRIIKKVIKAADLNPQDIVLEIGPGLGALTKELAKKARKVIAVEKDSRMCQALKENLREFNNVEIINQDILKIPNTQFPIPNKMLNVQCRNSKNSKIGNWKLEIGNYKIVANLPFYITAPVIRKFLEAKKPPKEMILIIQKEVAQRIYAQPPKMSILAVSVQFYADSKIISYVSKKSFSPQPKVDAAIIKLKIKSPCLSCRQEKLKVKKIDVDKFFRVVKAGFSQPRKQLANNLSKGLRIDKQKIAALLAKINIRPTQRAETLTVRDWIKLSNNIHNS